MTPRRAIALLFYVVMIAVGAWCAYEWLVLGGRGIAFRFGAFLTAFGAYLIWTDFLSPEDRGV